MGCKKAIKRVPLSHDLTPFQILGQKFVKFFVGILVQTMTPKGHFEINWPLGGMRTLEVDDLTIFVVVIVIGESLKLLLRLVRIGLLLEDFNLESSAGRLAAFLKHVIQLFLMPSVMAENTMFLPSKVWIEKPKLRGRSVFSTCCTSDKSMIPSRNPLLSAFGSR